MLEKHNAVQLARVVKDHIEKNEMSLREFGRVSELSVTYIQQIVKEELRDIKISTLGKISKAVSMSLFDLMLEIGLINQPRKFFFASELSRVATDKHKKILEKHGNLIVQLAEKLVLSEINPEQLELIVNAIAEVKK